METNEVEGFFPEREILRARRLRAMVDLPVDPPEARTRRKETWFVLSVAIFLPMIVNGIVFGWNGHITPRALEVLLYVLSFVLVGCVGCVALVLWRRFNTRAL